MTTTQTQKQTDKQTNTCECVHKLTHTHTYIHTHMNGHARANIHTQAQRQRGTQIPMSVKVSTPSGIKTILERSNHKNVSQARVKLAISTIFNGAWKTSQGSSSNNDKVITKHDSQHFTLQLK